ncbi:MAG: 50S ribosomal protein L6 [Parcubacteria group bacterium]
MSRIGKKPVDIPAGVEVKIDNDLVLVKGGKGALSLRLHPKVKAEARDGKIFVAINDESVAKQKALWGLYRSLINNLVIGVTRGFEKKLEVNGIGYKAAVFGRKLILNVGFSHPVEFALADGVNCSVEKNIITLSGSDKQLVGEMAACIRRIRKPEPYKGTGIKYLEEVIRRKAGKTAGKGAE